MQPSQQPLAQTLRVSYEKSQHLPQLDWVLPKHTAKFFETEFDIEIDVCANATNSRFKLFWTEELDKTHSKPSLYTIAKTLNSDKFNFYINPPFKDKYDWLQRTKKSIREFAQHHIEATVVFIYPFHPLQNPDNVIVTTTSQCFNKQLYPSLSEIVLFKERINFGYWNSRTEQLDFQATGNQNGCGYLIFSSLTNATHPIVTSWSPYVQPALTNSLILDETDNR